LEGIRSTSMMLRWCCSVHKSAPMIRLVREIVGRNDSVRIVVFDGVREEESTRRKGYSRLAENVKHFTQINAEVIKRWTTTEVYTYILARELPLNKAYRSGAIEWAAAFAPLGQIGGIHHGVQLSESTESLLPR